LWRRCGSSKRRASREGLGLAGGQRVAERAGRHAARGGVHFHPAGKQGRARVVSTIFLITYVTHKALVHGAHTKIGAEGFVRGFYYVILITHIVLAAAIVPMALITMTRALRKRFDRHRAIARWTWPIWMYVSVTGVLIYFMLYHWFPAAPL
jgi:putative membrane protein